MASRLQRWRRGAEAALNPLDYDCPTCARKAGEPCFWWPAQNAEFHATRIGTASIRTDRAPTGSFDELDSHEIEIPNV